MSFFKAITKKIDLYLIATILFIFAINLPYLNERFMVGHDTKNIYITFHYFFSHLVNYHELPRWLPYGEYGYSSLFYQICNLSPFTYLTGLVGWLLRITDTLLLFKYSVLAEQLAFALGLHLLGKRLYSHRQTAFLITITGAGSVIWYWQLYWDLRLYYLLPLAIYFYHRFIEDKTPWAFWAGNITVVMGLVGGLAYWAPVYAYLFLVMAVLILPGNWKSLRSLLTFNWRNMLLFTIFVCICCAFAYVVSTCLEGLHNYSPGRSSNGMKTLLSTYLTYTPPENWWMLHSLLDGTRPNTLLYSNLNYPLDILRDDSGPDDLTMYTGLLPVAGFIIALVSVRSRWFICCAGAFFAMFALAGSGLFSWILYWIMPGMNKFRHLTLLLEIAKVLLLLASGFGIDWLLHKISTPEWLKKKLCGFNLGLLILFLLLIIDMLVSITVHKPDSWADGDILKRLLPTGGLWVAVRIATWITALLAIFYLLRARKLAVHLIHSIIIMLMVVAGIIDMATFQAYYWDNRVKSTYNDKGKLPVAPMRFLPERSSIRTVEGNNINRIIMSSSKETYLAYYANILFLDPQMPVGRVDIFPKGVHDLVSARGPLPTQATVQTNLIPGQDWQLRNVMGCNYPKIRFVSQSIFANTDKELSQRISLSPNLDSTVVLRGKPIQATTINVPEPANNMIFTSSYFNANRLDLDVAIRDGSNGWLVYADSYSPYWKAYIDGVATPVAEAYLAFKAIAISGGKHHVSFRYENTKQQIAMGFLIAFGILFSLGCLLYLTTQIFCTKHDKYR